MTTPARIALLSGSIRKASINRQAVKAVAAIFKDLGAKPTIIDLADYEMPIYHGDWEEENGAPEAAKKLIRRLKRFDGVYISTPEYNGGLPALLKNTIDWTTCVELGHFKGPVYGIGAASPGGLAGIMALRELRFILTRLGAVVVPTDIGVGNANAAFDKKGRFVPGRTQDLAVFMAQQVLAEIARRA